MNIPVGSTSVIGHYAFEDSSSTTGEGLTGVTSASSGLTGYWVKPNGTLAALTFETITTLGTYQAPTSANHLRIKELSAANAPGGYEFHFPDDWFSVANSYRDVTIFIFGVADMMQFRLKIVLDFALQPTVKARTLDVTATGAAGIDWGNIENPTATQNLSGTNIDPDQVVASVTGNVGGNVAGSVDSVTDPVTVGTNSDKTGYGLADGAITTAKLADGALTAAKFASGAFDAVWTVTNRALTTFGTLVSDIWNFATRVLTAGTNIVLAKGTGVTGFNDLSEAQVNAQVDLALSDYDPPTRTEATADKDAVIAAIPTVGAIADQVWDEATAGHQTAGTTGKALTDAGGGGSAPTVEEIVDGVWNEPIAGHLGSGSTGNKLNAAGAAGDPWSTLLPGSYGPGEAGYIVGNNLDAQISDLLGQTIPTPVISDDCADMVTFDLGEKKPVKASLLVTSGTVTIDSATVTLKDGLGNVIGTLEDEDATDIEAGAGTSRYASFELDTNEPMTGDDPLALGTYALVFTILSTGSDLVQRTNIIEIGIQVIG